MSFQSLLDYYQSLYTNFSLTEYSQRTHANIVRHIQLPYQLGAKNTPSNIANFLKNKLWDSSNYNYPPDIEIQTYVNNNKANCGVDCSGLVLYVLNEASRGAILAYYKNYSDSKISGYSYGVSASLLSSTSHGFKKEFAQDIVPGCTFKMDNGRHVAVVYNVVKNPKGVVKQIQYAHSNGSKGPHTAYIIIGDETKDLKSDSQIWCDSEYSDSRAKSLFNQAVLLKPIISLI